MARANHDFGQNFIVDGQAKTGMEIHFQNGPIKENGLNGVQAPEVLQTVISYLTEVNVHPFATRETSLAITKIEEAIHWLDVRTKYREARGIEGRDVT